MEVVVVPIIVVEPFCLAIIIPAPALIPGPDSLCAKTETPIERAITRNSSFFIILTETVTDSKLEVCVGNAAAIYCFIFFCLKVAQPQPESDSHRDLPQRESPTDCES